jgi:hypothetical protein
LPLPPLPGIVKKKLIPKALPPNPKKEAKKDETEKKADALLKQIETERLAKKAAAAAAQKKADKEAAAYRYVRAWREQRAEKQAAEGKLPHTDDELWTFHMPEGFLKGYAQLRSK